MVIDLQTDEKSVFIADRWLAVDKEDGLIETFIPEATEEELKDFSYLFSTKTRIDLTDAHLWFSVYARPPRSPFTRCQRFSVAVTSLFCAMLASLMFYRAIPKGEPSQENQVAGFSFTWKQVKYISICFKLVNTRDNGIPQLVLGKLITRSGKETEVLRRNKNVKLFEV